MNLLEFVREFPTEDKCLERFVQYRLERGITCARCEESTKHYFVKAQKRFECKKCKKRTSYKSGTLMEKSKINIQTWFMILHLMTSIKKSLSALEVSRQLGIRYDTVWYAMQKVRCAMGKRDAQYKLSGNIEIDDAFFVTVDMSRNSEEPLKRGRGLQRTSKVLVMVESEPATREEIIKKYGKETTYNKKQKMGYVKMIVVDDLSETTINYEAEKHLDENVSAISDNWKGYRGLAKVIKQIKQRVTPP